MRAKKTAAAGGPQVAVYHGDKNISGLKVTAALTALRVDHVLITAAEIVRGDLARFGAVIFPGGHSIRIGAQGEKELRRWLTAGGGMVGICAGCQFAARLQLLPVAHHVWRATGIVDLRLVARHPITRGYQVAGRDRSPNRWRWKYTPRGRVRMRYANGGLITLTAGGARRATIVASYDEAGQYGAVVAGECGRGRVVLIAPHPESTPPPPAAGADADRSQDPLKLFHQAVRFAVGDGPAKRRGQGR